MQEADNDNIEALAEEGTERPRKMLSPAAKRALAEAEERRRNEQPTDMPAEIGGRGGADPARFGDWEINGRAIDF
ncbi:MULTISPECIES: DUF1674 domain-containing protein [unclassified Rhizobium]|uniref:DUF1674 domain-containing protein n=1 Tax=unclassified Rhizobium TaxID=2613769 RepID=UPI001ADC979F|nr:MULTISPECIES: DUF1674 domain-containing protein [unclassified Rhizobium]MBO9122030.1 DUF1674 domain-containing protein [Rhizobium sp. 16-488-2b]MBO9172561.1 DUF1674 domain-containing protein [Rhizobium sp. 16-488-2a]